MSAHRLERDLARSDGIILDPGDGGNISVDRSGVVCQLVSAGAETRTLLAPSRPGIIITLHCKTYVGDIVVSAGRAINATNNNTLTFGVVNDSITLQSVIGNEGTNRWAVLANDGVALSTV